MGKGSEKPKILPIKRKYKCFFCGKIIILDIKTIYPKNCTCGCGYAIYQFVEDIYENSVDK